MEPGHRAPPRRQPVWSAQAHPPLQWLRRAGGEPLWRDGSAEIFLMTPSQGRDGGARIGGTHLRAIRWVLKPLVFIACLVPACRLTAGAFGFAGISLGADPVMVMLHTCGKWTLNFLMITLCMTPLRDLTHAAVWLRFRRMFGLFAFFYVLLHFAVYLLLDQAGKLGALWQDVIKRPYITIGMSALLMLIPLAATST